MLLQLNIHCADLDGNSEQSEDGDSLSSHCGTAGPTHAHTVDSHSNSGDPEISDLHNTGEGADLY